MEPTLAGLLLDDTVCGLILHCGDEACGRRIARDLGSLPPTLTISQIARRARCDWCGSLRSHGVLVEVLHIASAGRVSASVRAERRHRTWRAEIAWTARHPFSSRRRTGRWGNCRPEAALIARAHQLLGLPMCNLYANLTTQEAMRRLFKAEDTLGNQPPLPAIFPDMEVPVVRIDRDGRRQLVRARWGWQKARFGWVTNVRNLGGWPWKHVIEERRQRCLVPASSFAEYHPTEKTERGHKQAVWFRLTGDEPRPPFAFAGFLRRWTWEKDGLRKKADQPLAAANTPTNALAFLTCEPNGIVAPVHPKAMPVILRPDQFETWLTGDADAARALQKPLPDSALEIAFVGAKADEGEAE